MLGNFFRTLETDFYNMEQIIPILIAAVIFGFQAYANYQKEQEKAKKRNLGKPPLEEFPEFQTYEEVIDDPTLAPSPTPSRTPSRTPRDPQTTRGQQPQRTGSAPNPFARYEGAVQSSKLRRSTKQTDLIPEVKLADLDQEDHSPFATEEEFDLRKAVIASAILERPYKD